MTLDPLIALGLTNWGGEKPPMSIEAVLVWPKMRTVGCMIALVRYRGRHAGRGYLGVDPFSKGVLCNLVKMSS